MISIQTEDFSPAEAHDWLVNQSSSAHQHGIGGIVTFTGLVRDMNLGESVGGLFLEHYAGMTEKALQSILDEAHTRWNITAIRLSTVSDNSIRVIALSLSEWPAHIVKKPLKCEFVMDA